MEKQKDKTGAARTVEELPGHVDVAATMIYAHVHDPPGVAGRSPLDNL